MTKTIRVSDLIVDFIHKLGVNDLFMVTGGGAMFLNDAVYLHPKIKAYCNHHEQACAMAAVGYSKLKNSFSAAIFTTGCGATNSLTGLLDAWQDNVPCFFVSGQVKRKETSFNARVPLRQHGIQEANIINIVRSISKYSVMINEPNDILYELQKAAFIALNGRPGPIWIDVPLDVQGANVEIKKLKQFKPPKKNLQKPKPTKSQIKYLIKKILSSERPIIIAGNGVRLSGAEKKLLNFIQKSKIPVAVSYLGVDLLPSNHDQYVGRLGIKGDRAGNFAVMNSDLVITIGCHLSVALTGFEYELFARDAYHIVIDIDKEEHKKDTVRIDNFIHSDAMLFFDSLPEVNYQEKWKSWGKLCRQWRKNWPVALPIYEKEKNGINKYTFIEKLGKFLKPSSAVISDAGSSYYVTSQALKIRQKQRYITSGAQADMGFTLPAAIGVSIAMGHQEVVGITGDGSLQMNIQELQTLVHYNIPVKLVVWNNNGYLSIRATQSKFFSGRAIGTDSTSGVSFPSTKKIATAYQIPYLKVTKTKDLDRALKKMMAIEGPVILEVICPENQEVIPSASSKKLPDGRMVSKPLEDMYPFLDREEFLLNMIIEPINENE